MSQSLDAARKLKEQGSLQPASEAYEALLPRLRSGANSDLLAPALFESSQVALSLGDYPRAAEQLFSSDRHSDGEIHIQENIGIVRALA